MNFRKLCMQINDSITWVLSIKNSTIAASEVNEPWVELSYGAGHLATATFVQLM
jgi:hypothetical protein